MKILISAMLMLLGLMSFEYLTSKANSVLEIILEVSIFEERSDFGLKTT